MKLGEVLNLLNSFVAQFSWKWLFHEKERNSLIFVNIRVELFNFCFFDILPIWARMVRNKLRNSRVVLNPDFSKFSNNVSRLVINEQWQQINCSCLKKTVGHRTMSDQIWKLCDQTKSTPDILSDRKKWKQNLMSDQIMLLLDHTLKISSKTLNSFR